MARTKSKYEPGFQREPLPSQKPPKKSDSKKLKMVKKVSDKIVKFTDDLVGDQNAKKIKNEEAV